MIISQDLLEVFPDFYYKGQAFRAVCEEWNYKKPHVSWSKKKEGSIYAYQSNNNGRQNYWMYKSQVKGFDVKAFVDYFNEEIEQYICRSNLVFAEREFEIIVFDFSLHELELIG